MVIRNITDKIIEEVADLGVYVMRDKKTKAAINVMLTPNGLIEWTTKRNGLPFHPDDYYIEQFVPFNHDREFLQVKETVAITKAFAIAY